MWHRGNALIAEYVNDPSDLRATAFEILGVGAGEVNVYIRGSL
jgi:hypothetical protein